MLVEVTGKPRRLKAAVLNDALTYAFKYLRLEEDGWIDIVFKKDCDAHGYATHDEEEEYGVEINSTLSVYEMVGTLFHELVHIKQYATGRLVSAEGRKPNRWEGKVCRLEYAKQPWEVEAYDLERKMMRNFKRNYKHGLDR